MSDKSFPELAQQVSDIIHDRETLKCQITAAERELEVYKKALDIESDPPYRDWLLDQARKELQNGKEL
jgi:hypothetical protein